MPCFNLFMLICLSKEEEGQGGDQDQEEKRWNKRTQQMLHGLQVSKPSSSDYSELHTENG